MPGISLWNQKRKSRPRGGMSALSPVSGHRLSLATVPLYLETMYHGTTIPDLISEFGLSGTRAPIEVHSPPWPQFSPRTGATHLFKLCLQTGHERERRRHRFVWMAAFILHGQASETGGGIPA